MSKVESAAEWWTRIEMATKAGHVSGEFELEWKQMVLRELKQRDAAIRTEAVAELEELVRSLKERLRIRLRDCAAWMGAYECECGACKGDRLALGENP